MQINIPKPLALQGTQFILVLIWTVFLDAVRVFLNAITNAISGMSRFCKIFSN
jgi:hypothetical protein